jgi:hypothetical protein
MIEKTEKTCSKCSCTKLLAEFYPRKDFQDGYMSRCRECVRKEHSGYYKDNNEKIRAYRRNFGRISRYGITEDEVREIIASQNWKCAICERKIEITAHVDHDHETGVIRGVLCKQCNIALGLLSDNAGTVIKAALAFSGNIDDTGEQSEN